MDKQELINHLQNTIIEEKELIRDLRVKIGVEAKHTNFSVNRNFEHLMEICQRKGVIYNSNSILHFLDKDSPPKIH